MTDRKALEDRIAELQEQNAYLREAATTFAGLAERLNEQLREEMKRGRAIRRSLNRRSSAAADERMPQHDAVNAV
jgi:hypothetical protein